MCSGALASSRRLSYPLLLSGDQSLKPLGPQSQAPATPGFGVWVKALDKARTFEDTNRQEAPIQSDNLTIVVVCLGHLRTHQDSLRVLPRRYPEQHRDVANPHRPHRRDHQARPQSGGNPDPTCRVLSGRAAERRPSPGQCAIAAAVGPASTPWAPIRQSISRPPATLAAKALRAVAEGRDPGHEKSAAAQRTA